MLSEAGVGEGDILSITYINSFNSFKNPIIGGEGGGIASLMPHHPQTLKSVFQMTWGKKGFLCYL